MTAPLCKDCVHCRPAQPHWWLLAIPVIGWVALVIELVAPRERLENARCAISGEPTVSLVTGSPTQPYGGRFLCSAERQFTHTLTRCHPEGKNFEAKP